MSGFVLSQLAHGQFTSSAASATVNFNDPGITQGRILDTEYVSGNGIVPAGSGLGFSLAVTSPGTFPNSIPDFGVIYDSRLRTGQDPDLHGPNGIDAINWQGGNLVGVNLGNLLVIQEAQSSGSPNNPTVAEFNAGQIAATKADDNGNGGTITFTFEAGLRSFGFNWADLDDPAGTYLRFRNTFTGVYAQIDFRQFSDTAIGNGGNQANIYRRTGVDWAEFDGNAGTNGDEYANAILNITLAEIASSSAGNSTNLRDEGAAAGFQLSNTTLGWRTGAYPGTAATAPPFFNEVTFVLAGSGAIALVAYELVPEPATVALWIGVLALGTVTVARWRLRRG